MMIKRKAHDLDDDVIIISEQWLDRLYKMEWLAVSLLSCGGVLLLLSAT